MQSATCNTIRCVTYIGERLDALGGIAYTTTNFPMEQFLYVITGATTLG